MLKNVNKVLGNQDHPYLGRGFFSSKLDVIMQNGLTHAINK